MVPFATSGEDLISSSPSDLLTELAERHGARDTTARGTAMAELEAMESRSSQHQPGFEVPERHWMYRFAKKHWFFGFGAYT